MHGNTAPPQPEMRDVERVIHFYNEPTLCTQGLIHDLESTCQVLVPSIKGLKGEMYQCYDLSRSGQTLLSLGQDPLNYTILWTPYYPGLYMELSETPSPKLKHPLSMLVHNIPPSFRRDFLAFLSPPLSLSSLHQVSGI